MRDDGFGQIDGDGGGPSPFAVSYGEQPWLRSGVPPWHMWGNTIAVSQTLSAGSNTDQQSGQLIKIAYFRPETWHFILSMRLLRATAAPLGTLVQVSAVFDLTAGIGRSIFQTNSFETLLFRWENTTAPLGVLWATRANAPALVQSNVTVPLPADVRPVEQIVGQDIQMNFRASLSLAGAIAGHPYSYDAEVSAFFAPKSHIRPDWFRQGPPELRFAGAEVGGR